MAAAGGKTYSFKVVLLGEGCVGKTSLVLRYCENKFNDKHITTLQASFLTKKLNITGKRVNLAIWVSHTYIDELKLIYDDKNYDNLCQQNAHNTLKCSLGNFYNLSIFYQLLLFFFCCLFFRYAESVGAKHYHTSAKLNKGIEELFLDLCKRMMEMAQAEERSRGNGASHTSTARRGVQIVDDEPQTAMPAGGCCTSG
uniref:RAB21, member RAS oncogene family n=1 Tax=Sinocyclocheilus grahami TaxID=75366 RepID=A0A672QMJ2_SINGR